MLALGADVNFYDYIHVGNSPLHRAALQGRRDVVEVFLCLICFLKKNLTPLLPKPFCSATETSLQGRRGVLECSYAN
jgi:ankyrin repeat protein